MADQIITFENGKLLCDGVEISIEEAEAIIKKQLEDLDKSVEDQIVNNPDISREEIDELSKIVVETKYKIGEKSLKTLDLQEYYDAEKLITDGLGLVTGVLKPFFTKKLQIDFNNQEKNDFRPNIKWLGNKDNNPDYVPSMEDMLETGFVLIVKEIILKYVKVLFPSNLNLGFDDIFIKNHNTTSFEVEIKKDTLTIGFQIDQNDGSFGDTKISYIATNLQIGKIRVQEHKERLNKHSTDKFKAAQTLENLIMRELRFLKNFIKEEISYISEKSIQKISEKLAYSKKLKESCEKVLDSKNLAKLNDLITELEEKVKISKNTDSSNLHDSENIEDSDELKMTNIENSIKNNLFKVFNTNNDQSKFITKKNRTDLFIETFLEGQKINIAILNLTEIRLSSFNSIGTGKTDLSNFDITGTDINEKIDNIGFFVYFPIIFRQIENSFSLIKSKKISTKELEKNVKEAFFNLKNYSKEKEIRLTEVYQEIEKAIDFIQEFEDKFIISFLDVLDYLFDALNYEFIKNLSFTTNSIYQKEKGLTSIYKASRGNEESIVESLSNVKKLLYRIFYSDFLAFEINNYKQQKEIEENKTEDKIKSISDKLSEDILVGSYARKILSLMNISVAGRNELFKNNLETLILDIMNIRFNW